MTTATNETCIGSLHKNCYLVREFFLVREMANFFATGKDSPPICRVSSKVWGKRQGIPYIVGATRKIKGGEHFY